MNPIVALWVIACVAIILHVVARSFSHALARVAIRLECAECGHALRAPLGALVELSGARPQKGQSSLPLRVRGELASLWAFARLSRTLHATAHVICASCRAQRSCTVRDADAVLRHTRKRVLNALGPYLLVAVMGTVILAFATWLLSGLSFLLG